ncbi:farnesyl pyrophosphate synthase-like isoform X3 [Leptopilina heterotoma]|uniref:farnesyl pyrophosphate synthase-like isoform X3 n=1 Tax=Leptopilina heterotoma TaxID=63436 RepID=UPI001CA7E337|nr:farnesyl pyrophosphate synthase-like isoform X3 [Leptopilina heterotoma]
MRKTVINLYNKRLFNIHMERNIPQRRWISSKDEKQEMLNLWPSVVRDLTDNHDPNTPQITNLLTNILQYNVPKGKMTRARDLVIAYQHLAPPDELNEKNIRLARILGWCNELLQAFIIIEDDIMDRSISRRGQPCWYLQDDIGLAAIKHGFLVEQMIYRLLKMHFREKPCYPDLVDIFHNTIYKTTAGEYLDLFWANFGKKPNLNLFTMDRYNTMIKYKTSYCSFILPTTVAKNFAGIKDNDEFRQVDKLLIEIGNFFQNQNDFLDCFGNPEETGKIGTDIQEGKCTWLSTTALQLVNSQQRKILEECYGENDGEKSARVKELYHELKLQTIYNDYEEKKYNLIINQIKQKSPQLLQNLLLTILNSIYRRNK